MMLVLVERARVTSLLTVKGANGADAGDVGRRGFEAVICIHRAIAPDPDCEVSKTRDASCANAN